MRVVEWWYKLPLGLGTTLEVVSRNKVSEQEIGVAAFLIVLEWVRKSDCSYKLKKEVLQTNILEQRP